MPVMKNLTWSASCNIPGRDSTIIFTNCSKDTSSFQSSFFWALAGSPSSRSTSAGRDELGIYLDVLFVIQPQVVEGDLAEILHRMGAAGGDHVIIRLGLLQHQPHGPYIVPGKTPVALGVQVAQTQLIGQPQLDPGPRDR